MRLLRLQLFDYRNFHRLDVELSPGPAVVIGDNAQGKTNLLDAVYLLATMRSLQAETDVQLIRRETLDGVLPAARVLAWVETLGGSLKVEVGIAARAGPLSAAELPIRCPTKSPALVNLSLARNGARAVACRDGANHEDGLID